MTNPLVSIILPTYNGNAKRLSASINSVLSQTYIHFELIIINDASTNGIETTILEFANKDKRILYVKNERNLKLTKTLNRALTIAKGTYIARIDDDDIWFHSNKLEKQITFLETHLDYGLIGTNAIIINENENELYRLTRHPTDTSIRKNMLVGNCFVHPSIVMRTTALQQAGGSYNPLWNLVEDYELRLRIGRISKMANLSDYGVKYRINTSSITRTYYKKQKRLTFKLFWENIKYYPHNIIKALIFRIGEIIVPPIITLWILKKLKNINV